MKNSVRLTIINLLLAVSSLPAATHYVSQSWDKWSTPPYTNWLTAAWSIQVAVDVAEAGDTVVVSNGVYMGGGRLTVGVIQGEPYDAWSRVAVTKAIALVSVNGAQSTIIDGGGNFQGDWASATNRCVWLADGASLTGFTVTNGFLGYVDGGGVYCPSSRAFIINCILTGNFSKKGSAAYGGTFYNCTVTGNSAWLGVGGVVGCTLYNCIVEAYDVTSTLNYCCARYLLTTGVGNITNDPLFVAYRNLHLQFNSPCINAGNNAYVMTTTDADGNPRIVGGKVDIGAYEYQDFSSLPPPQVSTLPATAVTATAATLNGTVNPNGWPTTAWFQWGTTTNYGNLTSVTDLGRGTNALPLSAPLAGLILGTTYHFRAAATNIAGVAYGSDQRLIPLSPPEVWTLSATAVVTNSATLNGRVNPNGYLTAAWFQWGTTTNYGNLTASISMGSGTNALALSVPIAGLIAGAPYYFRVVATNSPFAVYGNAQNFTAGSTFSDADWVSLGSEWYAANVLAVSGTNLYAGGLGSGEYAYVAKWNGSTWSGLGSGIIDPYGSGDVFALAASGTDLYVGGRFTNAGWAPATHNIAKWNGSAWSPLGSGMNSVVSALAMSGTNLYAGTISGPGLEGDVFRWFGSGWYDFGVSTEPGYYPEIRALAVSGSNLYAGGYFTSMSGVAANNIASWDDSGWSALGLGVGIEVVTLAVSGTNLYAGGNFTTAGGASVNYIAKWDGSTWSALGSGVNGDVYALAVSGTDLYAGGSFTTAGGVPANHIAKWDGSAWSALGSGTDGVVGALAADGAGHLFVAGGFTHAGTKACQGIAVAILGSIPTILRPPQTQSAEAGAAVNLAVDATGDPPPFYQWYLNATNLISCSTNCELKLTNVDFSQAGAYNVVVSNALGTVTSAPAMLNVIAPVDRRPVPGVKVTDETASLLNVDYASSLSPAPRWAMLGSVSLTSTSQYYFDLTLPLPPQRFYRAWQTGTPGVIPSLDLHMVPAITLTGNIGDSWRLDYINQFGPIDAWVTLDTVALTNTSQLYFDTSAWRQPARLYRLLPSP